MMNRVWADQLEGGTQQWADVPARRKDAVREVLREDVASGAITPERYEEITGEAWEEEE